MIKYLIIIPALLLLAVLAAVVRTLLRPRKKSDYKPHENEEEALRLAEKLSEMIKYDTTSHAGVAEVENFSAFTRCLKSFSRLYTKNFRKPRSTEICFFTGRAKAPKSRYSL